MDQVVNRLDEASQRKSAGSLRLSTLIWLRWFAVAGQTATVMVVGFWFQFPLPFVPVFALIGASVAVNIGLTLAFPASRRVDPSWATAILAYDMLQLAGLLYLTGGLQNPFAILLLVPVMVSATTLEPDNTFLLGMLGILAATFLVFLHQPLPWFPGETLQVPLLYSGGLWVALVCALIFMAFYASRVAADARQLTDALTAAELVLQREQHLSALDGLAAAAAHELGTPLATIALVSKELEREVPPDSPLADDVRLLRSQSQRCREILARLTSLSSEPEEHFGPMPLSHIIEMVAARHRDGEATIGTRVGGLGPEPMSRRNPGLVYALGNLIENAVDFAEGEVRLTAEWDGESVVVTIMDDGPGFSDDIMGRLGEPYVTTRRPGRGGKGGLGLGFFIAKTLLERSGARIGLANRPSPESGALVSVRWPRVTWGSRVRTELKAAE